MKVKPRFAAGEWISLAGVVLAVVGTSLFPNGAFTASQAAAKDDGPSDHKASSPSQQPKDAAKANADDDPADDHQETDDDLTALVVPPALRASAKGIDKLKFGQELRGLLLKGMTADKDSLATARRHFEAAHKSLADEPRAPYAFGIALLAQDKPKEALEQFRTAASLTQAPFLPALQAAAWVSILKGDYAHGLPAMRDVANKIETTKGAWPVDHDRRHTAEWLGRMMGYLTGPGKDAQKDTGKNSDKADEIDRLARDLEKLLTGERKEGYRHGYGSIAARFEKAKAVAARPVDEVLAEARQHSQEVHAAAQAAETELKQLEDQMRELSKPHDQQLVDWSHELRTAATKHKQAAVDTAEANEEVDYYSTPQSRPQARTSGSGRYRRQVVSMRPENAQEKKAREAQLAAAKGRAQQAQATFDQTKQEMTDIKAERAKAEAEYHKTAAEKRPKISEARKKSRELAAHARELDHLSLTPEKIKSRVTALETYVPLDPEIEKNRLLATLKSAD